MSNNMLSLTLSGYFVPGLTQRIESAGVNHHWEDRDLSNIRIPVVYHLNDIDDNNYFLSQTRKIRSHAVLVPDRVLYELTGWKGKIKRWISKLFRWYLLPTFQAQNNYNVDIYHLLVHMNKQIVDQADRIKFLEDELKNKGV